MIGITGGYGKVGCQLARELVGMTPYPVLIGGRDADRARALADELGSRVSWQRTDVDDREMLDVFCSRCDLVINCAGPSRNIRDKVALSALRGNAHYIDAAGEEPLRDLLAGRSSAIREDGLSFILSAGTYPGLSGVFPSHLAQTYFDAVHSAELFFHFGDSRLSLNAAQDIVAYVSGFNCGVKTGRSGASLYYEEGRVVSGASQPRFVELPEPVGPSYAHPTFIGEMQRLAERHGMKNLRAYLVYGEAMLRALIAVKSETFVDEERERLAAERLVAAGEENVTPYAMYHVVMKGIRRGESGVIRGTLLHEGDHMRFVGKIMAAAARMILEGETAPGVSFMAGGVNASRMMALLDKDISVTVSGPESLAANAGKKREEDYAL